MKGIPKTGSFPKPGLGHSLPIAPASHVINSPSHGNPQVHSQKPRLSHSLSHVCNKQVTNRKSTLCGPKGPQDVRAQGVLDGAHVPHVGQQLLATRVSEALERNCGVANWKTWPQFLSGARRKSGLPLKWSKPKQLEVHELGERVAGGTSWTPCHLPQLFGVMWLDLVGCFGIFRESTAKTKSGMLQRFVGCPC